MATSRQRTSDRVVEVDAPLRDRKSSRTALRTGGGVEGARVPVRSIRVAPPGMPRGYGRRLSRTGTTLVAVEAQCCARRAPRLRDGDRVDPCKSTSSFSDPLGIAREVKGPTGLVRALPKPSSVSTHLRPESSLGAPACRRRCEWSRCVAHRDSSRAGRQEGSTSTSSADRGSPQAAC
jgi:hypothetical protein